MGWGELCRFVYASDADADELWPAANIRTHIYLWNPATKLAKLIPPLSLHGDNRTQVALDFGFNHLGYELYRALFLSKSILQPGILGKSLGITRLIFLMPMTSTYASMDFCLPRGRRV